MEKKVINAFCAFTTYKGQSGFDKDYIDRKVVKVVKKTGPNEHDFIIVDKIIETKRPIKDVVCADKDNCGVYAVIKTLLREHGEQYVDDFVNRKVEVKEDVCDITDMPDSLLGVYDKINQVKDIYKTLPIELTKGKDINEFFSTFKSSDINALYAKKINEILKKDKNFQKKVIKKVEEDVKTKEDNK